MASYNNPEDEYDVERTLTLELSCGKCDHEQGETDVLASGTQWGWGAEWKCSSCGAVNIEEGEWDFDE